MKFCPFLRPIFGFGNWSPPPLYLLLFILQSVIQPTFWPLHGVPYHHIICYRSLFGFSQNCNQMVEIVGGKHFRIRCKIMVIIFADGQQGFEVFEQIQLKIRSDNSGARNWIKKMLLIHLNGGLIYFFFWSFWKLKNLIIEIFSRLK